MRNKLKNKLKNQNRKPGPRKVAGGSATGTQEASETPSTGETPSKDPDAPLGFSIAPDDLMPGEEEEEQDHFLFGLVEQVVVGSITQEEAFKELERQRSGLSGRALDDWYKDARQVLGQIISAARSLSQNVG